MTLLHLRPLPALGTLVCVLIGAVAFRGLPCASGQSVGVTRIRPFVTGVIPVIGRNGAVGGVTVDAHGVVSRADVDTIDRLGRLQRKAFEEVQADLRGACDLRCISLSRVEQTIDEALEAGRSVPNEIQFLGGLTRVRYVFVYPDQKDIVLAGPAEPWTIDRWGNAVGAVSGQPVLQLEDLLVALRTVQSARENGIRCSIDPTDEGMRELRRLLSRQRQFTPAVVSAIERTLGPQVVTITGVSETSRFARVMLAADYRMKQIAMKLDQSPVRGLKSYVDMIRSGRSIDKNMMPRWWLACDYDPLARSDDGLAWELRGQSVKAMTEDDELLQDGAARPTGRASTLAQRWASQMTAAYDELAVREPVFGDLRNLMDLSVVAALIAHQDLLARAGCSLPHLTQSDSPLMVGQWNPPRTVDTQCSFVKRGRTWIVTASGGVQIDSWYFAGNSVEVKELAGVRTKALSSATTARWWWD